MPECQECGGAEFQLHDGFFYCAVCQTQSQDIRQLEHSFIVGLRDVNVSKMSKSRKKKKVKCRLGEGPPWTSWQAFNYILKGMTDELVALGAPDNFERTVLQIWACYLRMNGVAFMSFKEDLPKLGFPFRYRDGKILHNVETASKASRKKEIKKIRLKEKRKRKKYIPKAAKRKALTQDYDSHLSSINSSRGEDLNTTIETLSRTSKSSNSLYKSYKIPNKKQMTDRGYLRRKENCRKEFAADHDPHTMNKTKILCFLYTALLINGSPIQLCDILRYIREGHISYTIVSQFLPDDIKFGQKDVLYINCYKSEKVPTHGSLRLRTLELCRKLKFRSLPAPDFQLLVKRFATELLLPDQFADMAIGVLSVANMWHSNAMKVQTKDLMVPFEAKAVASILVLFKLLFGMDGVKERHLSNLAIKLQKVSNCEQELFVFTKWQQAIECRNTVLSNYYIPSRELTDSNSLYDPKTFLSFWQQCKQDPLLKSRQYQYSNVSKIETKIEQNIENLMDELSAKRKQAYVSRPHFFPSLNPGVTHIQNLISWIEESGVQHPGWLSVLNKDWSFLNIEYLLNMEPYYQVLQQNGYIIEELNKEWLQSHIKHINLMKEKLDSLTEENLKVKFPATKMGNKITSNVNLTKKTRHAKSVFVESRENIVMKYYGQQYWRLLPKRKKMLSDDFENEVLPKFSNSWSWLLKECSKMLHITTRDIYLEVLLLEEKLLMLKI